MKKSITIIGILAMVLFSIFSCKKTENVMDVEEMKSHFAVSIQLETGRAKSEKGVLVGSKAELENALSGKEHVIVQKAAKNNNVFVPVVGPVNPVDPSALCWEEIRNYYDAHLPQWLQTANSTCKDVYVCLTCPNSGGGLSVIYVIKPTSPNCLILEADYQLSKFGFSKGEYDSEAVSQFIASKK